MRRPPPERADEWARWLRANGYDMAPLTGQDARVMRAIDACWHAYAVADDLGREAIWTAVVSLFCAMQPKVWRGGLELVARAMDWGDREKMRYRLLQEVTTDVQYAIKAPFGVAP